MPCDVVRWPGFWNRVNSASSKRTMITQRAKLRRLAFIPWSFTARWRPAAGSTATYRPIHGRPDRIRNTIYVPKRPLPRERGEFLGAILPRFTDVRRDCLPSIEAGERLLRGGARATASLEPLNVTSGPPSVRREREILFACAAASVS